MSGSHDKRKYEILKKHQEKLWQDYEVTFEQMDRTLNDVDRNKLRKQADEIYEWIKKNEDELKQLEAAFLQDTDTVSKSDYNRTHLALHSNLHKIDFKTVEPTIRRILDNSRENCAALLLLQNSLTMGGEWCAARIREMLTGMTCDFKYWPVEIKPDGRRDEFGLLNGLSTYLDIEPQGHDLNSYSQAVVRRISNSLQSGSVVFIEFKKCDYLYPQSQVVCWFLGFWKDMVRELVRASQTWDQIKLITLIFIDGMLSADCLPANQRCTVKKFEKEKVLEIQLKNWAQDEIKEWMGFYSRLPRDQIDLIAKKIYQATRGQPFTTGQALLNELGR